MRNDCPYFSYNALQRAPKRPSILSTILPQCNPVTLSWILVAGGSAVIAQHGGGRNCCSSSVTSSSSHRISPKIPDPQVSGSGSIGSKAVPLTQKRLFNSICSGSGRADLRDWASHQGVRHPFRARTMTASSSSSSCELFPSLENSTADLTHPSCLPELACCLTVMTQPQCQC